MEKRLSTLDVPARFLKDVFLTGRIPWRVAPTDARVSYGMYIPPTKYPTKFTADDPSTDDKKLPLVVWIHGTGRDVEALSNNLFDFAEANACAVLAPFFPAGLDGPNDLDAYKTLRSKTLDADLVLLSILDEVQDSWPGISTDKFYLVGFSGGSQFAHRFLYLYPERLAAVSIGAPGRPTFLNSEEPWPAGVQNVKKKFGRDIHKDKIRQVPIHLVIGGNDSQIHGGAEFWAWMRDMRAKATTGSATEKRQVGESNGTDNRDSATKKTGSLPLDFESRLQTMSKLHAQWKEDGIESKLEIIDGFAHESSKLRPYALSFIKSCLEDASR